MTNKNAAEWMFVARILWICAREFGRYISNILYSSREMCEFVRALAATNILFVKLLQASAARAPSGVPDMVQECIAGMSDQVPWTAEDIDRDCLTLLKDRVNLTNISPRPINAGSISLVFTGQYCSPTGGARDVVIKIKRRQIREKLDTDIRHMMFLFWVLRGMARWFAPTWVHTSVEHATECVRQNSDLLLDQLDFEKETGNLIEMRENCSKLDYVIIPEVIAPLLDPDVIIMEFISGKSCAQLVSAAADTELIHTYAKQIVKFGIVSTLMHNIAHGDLHSGNILFSELRGRPAICVLDFGIMYTLPDEIKSVLTTAVMTIFAADGGDDENSTDVDENSLNSEIQTILLDSCIFVYPSAQEAEIAAIKDTIRPYIRKCIEKSRETKSCVLFDLLFTLANMKDELQNMNTTLHPSIQHLQLCFTMSCGLTMKLCGDAGYMPVLQEAIRELFQLDLL